MQKSIARKKGNKRLAHQALIQIFRAASRSRPKK